MTNRNNIDFIDEEERSIVESLKKIDIDSIKNDSRNIKILKNAAQNYIEKQDKKITLRISEGDLNKIKRFASMKGLRYQTLIKSILHQYLESNDNVV